MTLALVKVEAPTEADEKLERALIKALGLDRVPEEQRTLALHIAARYELDPMLRHLVMVEGKPYITRDGLLHVAHRSGVFDGIEVTDPVEKDGYWHVRATVYRKDISRGIAYPGRYPVKGKNTNYGPEMGIKVAEVMALRRAFDVSAPVVEERWERDEYEATDTQVTDVAERKPASLADKVARRKADIEQRPTTSAAQSAPAETADPPAVVSAPEPDPTPATGEVETQSAAAPSPDIIEGEVREMHPAALSDKDFRRWLADRFIGLTDALTHIRSAYGDDATIASITDEQRAATAAAVAHLAK